MGNYRKDFGKHGEDQAVKYLKKNGYQIIERNFRNKLGEIDIIAREGDVVSFIEVKSRNSEQFGSALEAINKRKMRKLSQVALTYIKLHSLEDAMCRFDVLALSDSKIDLIKNAFELDPQYLY